MKISKSEEKSIGNSETRTTPCSYTTNWTIAGGSLDDVVTFKTSDSLTDSGSGFSANEPLLLLKPPTSGSEPCEITLTFPQKHEIRQVYVRSTAHVYEIYYKSALLVSNDYLCTVHCSAVDIGAELHRESDDEKSAFINANGSDGEVSEKKSPSGSNVSNNEDDWVEVKNPYSPVDVISSLPTDTLLKDGLQDFYQATTQISDAEPSATITLRLLSLEDKGCVYVDEVYVFADPVDSTVSENQAAETLHGGNATGSSPMAMLIPTLLHLLRSNVGQSRDKHDSNTMVEKHLIDEMPKITYSTNNLNEHDKISNITVQQDMNREEIEGVMAQAAVQFPTPVLEKERHYCPAADCNNHVGGVLEQLLSRMSRIEDLFLKFEEKMVKPINSIEERLQQVESQLDVIMKNTVASGIPSCTRFSAPPFSSLDSTSSSFNNDGCAIPPYVRSELEKYETCFDGISKSSGEKSKSTSAPLFTPSLVITVPDFSCDEEDEQNNIVEPPKDSPCQNQKQPLATDDAFAAADTGFSSMTIGGPLKHSERALKFADKENGTSKDSKCTQISTVSASESSISKNAYDEPLRYKEGFKFTAPGFSSEDNGYDDKVVSPRIENEKVVHSSDFFAPDGDESGVKSISAATDDSVLKRQEMKQIQSDVGLQFCEGVRDGNSQGTTNYSPSARAKDKCIYTGESSDRENKLSILDRFKILRHLLVKTENGDDGTEKISGASFRNDVNAYGKDVPASLDIGSPTLKMKFASLDNSRYILPLEALFTDSEIEFHTYVQRGRGAEIAMKASYLSSLPDERRKSMQWNDLLVDIESYDTPVSSETRAGLRDPHENKQEEKISKSYLRLHD